MDGSAPPTSSDRAMPENAKETCDEDILEEKRPAEKSDEQALSQEKSEANIQLPKFLGTVVRAASSTAQQAATGCGCAANGPPENAANPDDITISITPTTGGQFDLTVERGESVENLKKIISRKLKVAKERICLLHRERLLRDGTLEENRLQDGSRLTLLPSVETGLLAQRPEQSVMQALESLNDSQVNDFLSGKAPLNLTMRLGDHMMLIQLQLSTVTPTSPTTSQSSSSNTDLNIGVNPSTGTNMPSALSNLLQSRRSTVLAARSTSSTSKIQNGSSRTASMISSLVSAIHATANCSTSLSTATTTTSPVCSSRATTASSVSSSSYSQIGSGFCNGQGQQSPRPGHNSSSASPTSASSSSSPSPPSATGNTACQSCHPYHHHHHHHHHHNHHSHHHHHHHNHHHHHGHHGHHSRNKGGAAAAAACCSPGNNNRANTSSPGNGDQQQQPTSEAPLDPSPPKKKLCTAHHHQSNGTEASRSTPVEEARPQSPGTSSTVEQSSKAASLDTRALVEASRNLTQKLKQLSSEENARRRHGAIIESMHHHGKGVYSGTFSGTLNPALQDRHGRPKRDISTIIHILNDLLCATPAATVGHYRHHHKHSSSRQHSLTSTSSTATATSTTGSSANLGCHDSNGSGYSTEELSKENEATKGKMRRLRLVMEQRRAQRRARQARQARAAPYTTQWAAVTPDPDPNHDPNTSTTSPGAATANPAEPQTEPELQPCSPEPVVA